MPSAPPAREAAAAASLGQVHRAKLQDGTEVACKLQYPDMTSTVEADLRQLRMAMAVYHRMDSAIQHDDVYTELSERLREELDYVREASQARLYGIMLAGEPRVHVPSPIEGLSTKRLLTMTWLDGRPLMRRLEGLSRGFGSLKVTATIGGSAFKTSVFPAKELGWLLPVGAR